MIPLTTLSSLGVLINFIVDTEFGDCFLSAFVQNSKGIDFLGTNTASVIPKVILDGYKDEDEDNERLTNDIKDAIESGCQCWVMDADVSISFFQALEGLLHKVTQQRPSRSKVLVYGLGASTNKDDSSGLEENSQIRQIFNNSLFAGIPDTLLISPGTDAANFEFDLLSLRFVGRSHWDDPILINSVHVDLSEEFGQAVKFKFEGERRLYNPAKLLNLEQRYVKVATFNYYPYSSYEVVPPGTGNANSLELMLEKQQQQQGVDEYPEKTLVLDGTESLLVIELCKKYNCTLLMVPDDGGEWGEIYDNYTGNGILGAVAKKEAEVSYGALYMWYHEHLFVDFSAAVSRSGITVVVTNPHVLDPLLIALLPFTASLWLAVVCCVLGESLAASLMERIHNIINKRPAKATNLFVESAFQVFQIHILQSISIRHNSTSARSMWMSIIIGGFIIGSSFSGSLSSFMTFPRFEAPIEPPIMAAKHIPWAATHNAWIYSIMESTSPITSAIRDSFQIHTNDDLMTIPPGEMNFSVERLQYNYFAFGDYITLRTMQELRVMREDIYFEYSLILMQSGWYLKGQLDDLVLVIQQSGIQKYWLMVTTYKQLDPSVQKGIELSNVRHGGGSKPLAITRLAGIFYMLGFGLAIALAAFIAELIYAKRSRRTL